MIGYVLRTDWFWAGVLLAVAGGLLRVFADGGVPDDLGLVLPGFGVALIANALYVAWKARHDW